MMIDKFLPQYHFCERHSLLVPGLPEDVYQIITNLNFANSRIIRLLYLLRGMPDVALTLRGFVKIGFLILEENPGSEIVLGFVGKVAKRRPEAVDILRDDFVAFAQKGNLKIVWNFHLSKKNLDMTRVCTETRVFCIGEEERKKFYMYWTIIRPFSGLIRRIILHIIKREAKKI